MSAFFAAKRTGAPAKLTARQRRSLWGRFRKGAKANGLMDGRWTCLRIVELIEQEYSVRYHTAPIGPYLASFPYTRVIRETISGLRYSVILPTADAKFCHYAVVSLRNHLRVGRGGGSKPDAPRHPTCGKTRHQRVLRHAPLHANRFVGCRQPATVGTINRRSSNANPYLRAVHVWHGFGRVVPDRVGPFTVQQADQIQNIRRGDGATAVYVSAK
jgi:hypothetical protein